MINFSNPIVSKFLKIYINAGFCAGVDKETIKKRGKKILSIIDNLEANNVRCEIYVVEKSRKSNYCTIITKIKDFKDNLFISDIAFAIAHPSFLRRIMLSAEERLPYFIRKDFGFGVYGGYGQPIQYNTAERNCLVFTSEEINKELIENQKAKLDDQEIIKIIEQQIKE